MDSSKAQAKARLLRAMAADAARREWGDKIAQELEVAADVYGDPDATDVQLQAATERVEDAFLGR